MAQIHSYYITNARSELKFSNNNLSEEELEATMRDITAAMIDGDEFFINTEEEDDDTTFSDDECINLDGKDTDNLHMEKIIDLDNSEFEDSDNSNEENREDNAVLDSQPNNDDFNDINFEALLAEEFD